MTRDQAVKIFEKAISIERMVDAYVEVGMLKLEEPKSVDVRIDEALVGRVLGGGRPGRSLYVMGPEEVYAIRELLQRARLKIVEK